ncbi:MAG: NUDIX domain-containing protein [Actinomycetota bacterium]
MRIEHIDNPNAPPANSLVPAASAIVCDDDKILLLRRSDNSLWTIPGGAMEIGETIRQTVTREVREETGLDVEPISIVGVYSDPGHVVEFSNGEVRQQFSICFVCRIIGGSPSPGPEATKVGFFAHEDIERLPMADSIRLRIRHFLERRSGPVIA